MPLFRVSVALSWVHLGPMASARTRLRVGPEFQVSAYTTAGPTNPDVVLGGDGTIIVVFDSGGDGSGPGIFARRRGVPAFC